MKCNLFSRHGNIINGEFSETSEVELNTVFVTFISQGTKKFFLVASLLESSLPLEPLGLLLMERFDGDGSKFPTLSGVCTDADIDGNEYIIFRLNYNRNIAVSSYFL